MATLSTEVIASVRHALDEGRFAHALNLVETTLANAPLDDELLVLKVDALLALERLAEALQLSVQLVTNAPGASTHWHALCRVLQGFGYEELALQVNLYALEHVTMTFDLIRFRGDTLFKSHRYDEALLAYLPVLKQFGEQVWTWNIWYNYSTCLFREGQIADSHEADRRSMRALQQVMAAGTVNASRQVAMLRFHQGMLYLRMEQWLLAEQAFVQSLKYDGRGSAALELRNTFRKEGKWLAATIMLPWAFRNAILDAKHKDESEENMMRQRAALPSTVILAVKALIAS